MISPSHAVKSWPPLTYTGISVTSTKSRRPCIEPSDAFDQIAWNFLSSIRCRDIEKWGKISDPRRSYLVFGVFISFTLWMPYDGMLGFEPRLATAINLRRPPCEFRCDKMVRKIFIVWKEGVSTLYQKTWIISHHDADVSGIFSFSLCLPVSWFRVKAKP